MRENFHKELIILKEMLLLMGKKSKEIITLSVESLKEQDLEKAKAAIALDDDIDSLEYKIEDKCVALIACQQPMASDLRRIIAILKATTDIERMGDYSVNIAKITLEIGNESLIKPLIDIPKMAQIIEQMVDGSIECIIREDIELATQIAEMDDQVDMLYERILVELQEIIVKDPDSSKQATLLLLVARHLERIADHTTNICERIISMVTGERVQIN